MANIHMTEVAFTRGTLMNLGGYLNVARNLSPDYSSKFGNQSRKIGDTFNVRKPQRFEGTRNAQYTPEDLKNIFTPIIWCKARGKKEARAGMLETIYRRGQVWHNKEIAHHIEIPLLSYPRSAEWDVMDAAAYIFEVMEQGKAYLIGGGMSGPEKDEDDAAAFAALELRERHTEYEDPDFFGMDDDGVFSSVGDDRWMHDRVVRQPKRAMARWKN